MRSWTGSGKDGVEGWMIPCELGCTDEMKGVMGDMFK